MRPRAPPARPPREWARTRSWLAALSDERLRLSCEAWAAEAALGDGLLGDLGAVKDSRRPGRPRRSARGRRSRRAARSRNSRRGPPRRLTLRSRYAGKPFAARRRRRPASARPAGSASAPICSHLASRTFCWLPPLSDAIVIAGRPGELQSAGPVRAASAVIARRRSIHRSEPRRKRRQRDVVGDGQRADAAGVGPIGRASGRPRGDRVARRDLAEVDAAPPMSSVPPRASRAP